MKTEILQIPNHVKNSACFSKDNLTRMLNASVAQYVEAGSYLFWEGDLADKLYYIQSGSVKLGKPSNDGKNLVFNLFREGDFFGQFDPYYPSKQAFNAEADTDSIICAIQQSDLELLLSQHSSLAIEFMKWMGLMHRLTQTKFRDLMMYGKPGALCSTLIRLSNSYGQQQGDNILITKKMTHAEIGEFIGAARESVNRMLSDLKKAGAVDYLDGHIIIHNIDFLKEICVCEDCPIQICRI